MSTLVTLGSDRQPAFQLVVNGQDITAKLRDGTVPRLESLTLTDNRGEEADELELRLTDHDDLMAIPPRGAEIRLSLGWNTSALVDKGSYLVDEIDWSGPPNMLTIRARAADFRGPLKTKRTQSWHDTTINDVVTAIAKRQDLTAVVSDTLKKSKVSHIDQTNESDIAFLTRLAVIYGATAAVKSGRLLFITQGTGTTASGTSLPSQTIERIDCETYQYQMADRDSEFTGVQANWNDKKGAKLHAEIVGDETNPKRLRYTYRDADQARRAAEAEWARISRQTATLSISLALGRPELIPETPLDLLGFKKDVDSTAWIATRVVHTLSGSGLRTSVEMESKAASA